MKTSIQSLMPSALLPAAMCGALMFGCAATPPSQELVAAREIMSQARESEAARRTPDDLRKAQRTLEQAEAVHRDDPRSNAERDLAYIADRQVRLAMVRADRLAAAEQVEQAEVAYTDALEEQNQRRASSLEETRGALGQVRSELAERGGELDERTRELQAREQELVAREQELSTEREARAAAEARLAAAYAQLAEYAQVRQEAEETIITLNGEVLFQTDRAELLPIARERLTQVAAALNNQPERTIVIEGHTDSQGSNSHNDRLSQQRADSVRTFFVSQGIPAARVTAVGRGESEPIADNGSPEGRANNRRVEIHLSGPQS